ncbi:MAG: efflux RND transporter permease subunit [Candidatus Erginobacter occultus]|nr:efflux RND transporter permease subunit [Candidatus Erginobacter occultus]
MDTATKEKKDGPLARLVRFFLEQKLVVFLLLAAIILWGISVAPFDWDIPWLPRAPIPVDAIPNLGENQQIVFTDWPGRSPQDVEDQVTYPLTVSLLGIPGVREVRSTSMFGASIVFLIFEDGIEFYWARSRILEKLNSLPAGLLPGDARPALGPDATALGQVFWYTIEGRDPDGNPAGGWDLHELRSIQDWYVRYGLLSAEGISEVASVGGFVMEYQVDVDPDALRAHRVTLGQVLNAVRKSNLDVGARVTEINRVEYIVRGRGFIRDLKDIEEAVVRVSPDQLPIRVKDVARVGRGPAQRRGALTKFGAEAVGGVVVVREGHNPLAAIHNVKARIAEISPGLPERAVVDWEKVSPGEAEAFASVRGFAAFAGPELDQEGWLEWLRGTPRREWPEWITVSRLEIVPFYDRTSLIHETLATLNDALIQQILITVIVVIVMIMHLRAALVISSMLPLAVLLCFILMKLFRIDSNLVSLAGIAIAIGSIVDMGIIMTENAFKHLGEADPAESRLKVVYRSASEVSPAILTAIATTVVSFLPVFTMTGAEGKMFIPLAFTKTFVLIASVFLALTVVPAAVQLLVAGRFDFQRLKRGFYFGLGLAAVIAGAVSLARGWTFGWLAGLVLLTVCAGRLLGARPASLIRRSRLGAALAGRSARWARGVGRWGASAAALFAVVLILARVWEPLGPERGMVRNVVFIVILIGGLLGAFGLLLRFYRRLLGWCLAHKALFLSLPAFLVVLGLVVWLGFASVFSFIPAALEASGLSAAGLRQSRPWSRAVHMFPGLGREFMPPLDEGSFLWMPTTMPHASIGEVLEVMSYQDRAIGAVPEVEMVVGKLGRAESALDPAPVSMIETMIHYKPEYRTDDAGRRQNFRYHRGRGEFVRDDAGDLIPDPRGRPYRQWRDHIRSPDDIWDEIVRAAAIPGTTSAPKLQPIETRLVMLQTGMRAPMGIKVRGPDLESLERAAMDLERLLRRVPRIRPETVNAERVVGKPYLEIEIDREAISRYGLNIVDIQETIAAAVGGMAVTTTVEGRERYPVRVRYPRELRDDPESIGRVLAAAMDGTQVPLRELAEVRYVRGPQMIRSEDTFLTAYVTFGGAAGAAEVEVVESARAFLAAAIERGEMTVPPGVSWKFAGTYEHQLRAAATLSVVLPLALGIIFLILYFQFRSVPVTLIVFSGIAVAWAGGFTMIWFYGQGWFVNFAVFGVNMRDLFQLHPINLSVAVWVGFLALFGIAVDDGVVMTTYLTQRFEKDRPATREEIRRAVIEAGHRRIRPCLMTSATTILALLPVLTATGRGADLLLPMALPIIGGMTLAVFTWFTVPVLYSASRERRLSRKPAE